MTEQKKKGALAPSETLGGITYLEWNPSKPAGSVLSLRSKPKSMTVRKQSPLALTEPCDGPQTVSMSSSSDGGRGRAGGEHTDINHPNQTADHRHCVVAKVISMGGRDSRPSEDEGTVESDVERPRAPSEEILEQGGSSADGTGKRLKALHQRLEEARDASDSGTLTHEHLNHVDWATNDAIRHLPLVQTGDVSDRLRWREPDQVSENDDMVPHDLVEKFRRLLKGYKGRLGDLLLNSKNQAELRAIFPGVEDVELHRLLNETQSCMEISAEPRNYSIGGCP